MSIFPVDPIGDLSVPWWAELQGEAPESVEISRQERRASYQGVANIAALAPDTLLALGIESQRIDWRLFTTRPFSESLGAVGPYTPAIEGLVELGRRFLRLDLPPILRLALGAILVLPAEDSQIAMQQLAPYLPFDPHPETVRDFRYRVNRRIDSTVLGAGHEINRIQDWSIRNIHMVSVRLGLNEQGSVARDVTPVGWATRLEVDVNTAPEPDYQLPSDSLPELLTELQNIALASIHHGDTGV